VSDACFDLPDRLRLKKTAEFNKVFDNPNRTTDRYFTVLASNNDLGHPRIGLAIAKKVVKTAVTRNYIKRTIRESFRLQQHTLTGIDVVVLVKKEAIETPNEILRDSLAKHWLKIVFRCAK
jgi:ribonuclease P protein component